ncbi:uncharacterized protein LOC130817659 [Amaranthus tricolor]|uniref:uncharacterized protein LOC130817659 n=1 Tax=Amaranthus tricolor TaxID=29722 RepID=UPI0025891F3B|nr:uncharacterized protein LOC130817659 [Amaranthus tricolor]
MASGSEDEQQRAWFFGSNSYVSESNSESEEESQIMEEMEPQFGKKVQEDNGRLRIQVRIPTQLVREAVAFLIPSRDQQQTQALTENEDSAQTTEIIQEAYDQAIEETQG